MSAPLKVLAEVGAIVEQDCTEVELEVLARNFDFMTRLLYQKVAANKARAFGAVDRAKKHEEDAIRNAQLLDPEARWF